MKMRIAYIFILFLSIFIFWWYSFNQFDYFRYVLVFQSIMETKNPRLIVLGIELEYFHNGVNWPQAVKLGIQDAQFLNQNRFHLDISRKIKLRPNYEESKTLVGFQLGKPWKILSFKNARGQLAPSGSSSVQTDSIIVLWYALTHMKCVLRLIICQTAKCWHLKVQLFRFNYLITIPLF